MLSSGAGVVWRAFLAASAAILDGQVMSVAQWRPPQLWQWSWEAPQHPGIGLVLPPLGQPVFGQRWLSLVCLRLHRGQEGKSYLHLEAM